MFSRGRGKVAVNVDGNFSKKMGKNKKIHILPIAYRAIL